MSHAKGGKGPKSSSEECPEVGSLNVVSARADSKDGLVGAFEAFRALLGGPNNGSSPFQNPSGHRQVNWDAPIVPTDMPGDFFANTVTRGLLLDSASGKFFVSNEPNSGDHLFDSINVLASELFQTFSDFRLFAPGGRENTFLINFKDPNPNSALDATVQGFGAIFVNVEKEEDTRMTFMDETGCVLAEEFVKASPGGLSFLGVFVGEEDPQIFEIEIELGKHSIDKNKSNGVTVMDDFLYSEPFAGPVKA